MTNTTVRFHGFQTCAPKFHLGFGPVSPNPNPTNPENPKTQPKLKVGCKCLIVLHLYSGLVRKRANRLVHGISEYI